MNNSGILTTEVELSPLFAVAVAALVIGAAACDCWMKKIPNWLTVSGFFAGIAYNFYTAGWQGLAVSSLGFLTGFGVLFIVFAFSGGGGGDVKLMTAVGAWVGWLPTVLVYFASVILLVVMLIGLALVRPGKVFVKSQPRSDQKVKKNRSGKRIDPSPVPYAVPIAIATCVWLVLKLRLLAG